MTSLSEKCRCFKCNAVIEFDIETFQPAGQSGRFTLGQKVPCPKCGQETPLSIETSDPVGSASTQVAAVALATAGNAAPPNVLLIQILAVIVALIGCGLVFSGCGAEISESLRTDGSAIRQTVAAIKYGAGFLMIAAAVIIDVLARILKRS